MNMNSHISQLSKPMGGTNMSEPKRLVYGSELQPRKSDFAMGSGTLKSSKKDLHSKSLKERKGIVKTHGKKKKPKI